MPNINIDDAYILNETGAQVDKVTGLFTKDEGTTSGEKAFAQLNIGTAGSNRNLLDNPWFTVNQRGTTQTSSGNSYIADRWAVSGNTYTWTYARAALSVTNASGSIAYLFQKLPSEVYADINGKTVTYSVMINGTVYSVPFTWDTTKRNAAITIDGLTGIMFWYGDQNQPCLRITVGGTWTVNAIKLELGSVSTLANEAPPRYKSELDDCNFYCRVLKGNLYSATGMAVAGTQVRFTLPYQMYKQPTPSFSGTIRVLGTGGFLAVSNVTVSGWSESSVEIACTVSGATLYTPYFLSIGANSQIILSADL